jgi:hypothetical protein
LPTISLAVASGGKAADVGETDSEASAVGVGRKGTVIRAATKPAAVATPRRRTGRRIVRDFAPAAEREWFIEGGG